MSNYPFSIDNNITLPGVSGSTQEDVAITALRSAVFAVETELGVTPSGIYADVRTRLDILEARIQFGVSPSIPNDGYVKSPLIIHNFDQGMALTISDGIGAPTENRLDGSLYMRGVDGYLNNQLYVRLDGYWIPIQTDHFVASGDLAGDYLKQEVIGLATQPLNLANMTGPGLVDGYFLTWNGISNYWEAQTGFIASGDLAPNSAYFGRISQTVVGIQNHPVSGVTPGDGYTFVWSASDNRWEPQARAVVFDGYVSRVNLRSNRFQQSPIDNTKTGIINLGTSTTGSGGTTGNYSIILGGDQNVSSGTHSFVGAGFINSATDGYSVVVSGNGNLASALNSTVINGTTNTASGAQSTVGNGTSNTASGTNSLVLNGTNNTAASNFSSILNGATNSISAASLHAAIGFGSNNLITGGAASDYSIILGGSSNSVNSAQNVLIGPAASSSLSGNYSVLLSGTSNTIATLSDYAVILTGINNNIVGSSSEFGFIGTGQNNTISGSGHFSTILNADSGSVNGNHATVLKGFNNSATGQFTTIVNGQNNTVNSAGWGLILDGYNNSVTNTGGFIADGYNNSVSGMFSSVINGNFNTVASRNSTILNGANNNMDATSSENTILVGTNNTYTNCNNTTLIGNSNTLTNVASHFVLGSLNNTQSTFSFINGSLNTIGAGSSFNRIFGSNNLISASATTNFIVGNGNNLGPSATTSNTTSFGSNNIIDGTNSSSVNGSSNIASANLVNMHGQFGKARLFGQEVRANSRFTATTIAAGSNGLALPQSTINVVSTAGFPTNGSIYVVTSAGLQSVTYTATSGGTQFTGCTGGVGIMSTGGGVGKIGETQWSRILLAGSATGGGAVALQLQDIAPANPTFVDGYSYDMSIKILVVNTNIGIKPVQPARYYIDVLAHQEGGILVLDNINQTLTTPNTSDSPTRDPWTVTVSTSGNQLLVTVDAETTASRIGGSFDDRRATASIDMREISRI